VDSVSCNLHIDLPTSKETGEGNKVSGCRGGLGGSHKQRLAEAGLPRKCHGQHLRLELSWCRKGKRSRIKLPMHGGQGGDDTHRYPT